MQRRGYADAVSDKIKLTLALPHQVLNPSDHCGLAKTPAHPIRWTLLIYIGI